MKPAIQLDNAVVYHGSNLDVLPTLPDNSVDSIVTDPPYELGFMGKSWDSTGIAYSVELWRECLRVLKPGGHLLAFGGSRTWHRLAVAIEDSGFEVRDSIAWLYGSGFPKSLDIAKAIQKASGVEPIGEVVNENSGFYGVNAGWNPTPRQLIMSELEGKAAQWAGWGTALKPAFEPVVVARKPLIGTVAANVLEWGVGGLNIDGSRIGTTVETWPATRAYAAGQKQPGGIQPETQSTGPAPLGRWPANIILDEYTAGLLDEQSGVSKPKPERTGVRGGKTIHDGGWNKQSVGTWVADPGGGASRFFYVAKASKRDRNEGLIHLETKQTIGGGGLTEAGGAYGSIKAPAKNFHPTVKPTDLMRYLIKLVTPLGGTVLDPFTGSGSTGKAALLEGFDFIGIELTDDYLPIIAGRLQHATDTRNTMLEKEETTRQETLFD